MSNMSINILYYMFNLLRYNWMNSEYSAYCLSAVKVPRPTLVPLVALQR